MEFVQRKMNYKIIRSGSKGNAVIIEDMLFDIGVPFNKLKKHLYYINYIFITHIHTDHLKISTVERIQKEFPRIKFIGNWEVASKIKLDHIVGDVTQLSLKNRQVQSFPCTHDVACHGYVIDYKEKKFIYATDTADLDEAPKEKYDYLFIESNHDENKINAVRNNQKNYGYDVWKSAKRHLSTQQSKAFYYMYRKNKESEWIELHKSERFY